MSVSIGFGPEFAELDDVTRAAYQHAVRVGRFQRDEVSASLHLTSEEAARVEQVLRMLCLLHPIPGGSDLLPVSPDAAAVELVGSTERQIRDLQQGVTEVRARMLSLMPRYFESRRARSQAEAFDVILDADTAQSMIDEMSDRCKSEVLTVQPGGAQPAHLLTAARQVALGILDRNVRMRTIYQHAARTDLVTKAFVRDLITAGAQIRTSSEVVDHFVVYDREVAFLLGRDSGATIVREPTVVAFMCTVFEHLWGGSNCCYPGEVEADRALEDVKSSIVRLMSEGYKDEMVARRLGISVRTCRRHIAELMEELQATSRFQAGVHATRGGLLPHLRDPLAPSPSAAAGSGAVAPS
ncbi:LuxR C-terminal-related transcriptional regulator [Streptomyces sp. NPDC008313]|uniref:helix-turn-helix transcriptional regulator n=1 Tax=Streptomyces sp. NPDC008313 TaxID=3364826 RepID=UPI0036E7B406